MVLRGTCLLVAMVEFVERIGAGGLQQPIPPVQRGAVGDDQRFCNEFRNAIHDDIRRNVLAGRDTRGRVDVEGASENGKASQYGLFAIG